MKEETGRRKIILPTVILLACLMIIVGAFMYGRLIGSYYRSSLEIAFNSFVEDIGGWIDEAQTYISEALNLAENPH